MSKVSVELAERLLTRFDGTKAKIYEFIDNCDKAYNIVKDEQKAILFCIIQTKITDNARSLIRNREFTDWESLKSYLLEAYSEKRTAAQWQLELSSCSQHPKEDVRSYAAKIENCYIRLVNTLESSLSKDARYACTNLLKLQALNVFICGLNQNLSILVKSQKPDSLEDAISIALAEEQEQKSKYEILKYQNINHTATKHCNNCNKSGHTTFNCYFNKSKQNSFQNVRHIANSYSSKQNFPVPRANSHKICNYCKKPGHEISECRKRAYNHNLRQTQQPNSRPSHSYSNSNNLHSKSLNSSRPTIRTASGTTNQTQVEFT